MVCVLKGAVKGGFLLLTLLISCATYSGDLLLDSLCEGWCTTNAGCVAEVTASLLDTGFHCRELETMYQHWVIGGIGMMSTYRAARYA